MRRKPVQKSGPEGSRCGTALACDADRPACRPGGVGVIPGHPAAPSEGVGTSARPAQGAQSRCRSVPVAEALTDCSRLSLVLGRGRPGPLWLVVPFTGYSIGNRPPRTGSRSASGCGWCPGSGPGSSGWSSALLHGAEPTPGPRVASCLAPLVWFEALDGSPLDQDPGPGVRCVVLSPFVRPLFSQMNNGNVG